MDQNDAVTSPIPSASATPTSDAPQNTVSSATPSDVTAPVSDTSTSIPDPTPVSAPDPTPTPAPDAPVTEAPESLSPEVTPEPASTETPSSDEPPVEEPKATDQPEVLTEGVPKEVIKKIAESHNVLVALSSDPSVDEMCAAIGLSLFLDKLGKRATAIYSGATPNALEFLKPEETFESTADTLQDFVIALNKDKADHLRYKLDGDYVKIYITPYKNRIAQDDLEFSYGDYNVDLVLALDVANGIDLDSALREHGRIMHDAVIINITTGNPGRFGEIEWSDKSASSVSEMIAKLLYGANSKTKIEKGEATAFLTGIVAATNRFSNAKTTPETMQVSSRLMQSGANQQLISKNITPDVDNELYSLMGPSTTPQQTSDPTKLSIGHEKGETTDEGKEVDTTITEQSSTLLDDLKAAEASLAQAGNETVPDTSNQPVKLDSNLAPPPVPDTPPPVPEIAPVQALEATFTPTPEPATATPQDKPVVAPPLSTEPVLPPVAINTGPDSAPKESPTESSESSTPESEESKKSEKSEESEKAEEPKELNSYLEPSSAPSDKSTTNPAEEGIIGDSGRPEKVLQPSPDMNLNSPDESSKYSKMLEDAIKDLGGAPSTVDAPITSSANESAPTSISPEVDNPASAMAPPVASSPEINGVPDMNYAPAPEEPILPPPPAPPVDLSAPSVEPPEILSPVTPITPTSSMPTEPVAPIEPTIPPVEPIAPSTELPSVEPTTPSDIPEPPVVPQSADVSAFKIPGM